MSIIELIQKRILLFISFYNDRPDYILLGKKQWSEFIRFFGHSNNVTIDGGNLAFDEIPVIRTVLDNFCEAVGGTEKIQVKIIEEIT